MAVKFEGYDVWLVERHAPRLAKKGQLVGCEPRPGRFGCMRCLCGLLARCRSDGFVMWSVKISGASVMFNKSQMLTINCGSCGHKNDFEQPYPFHAGFGDQGFLYNDAGNLTLVWSAFDPAYEATVGQGNAWALTAEQQSLLETALLYAASGGRWRFANPARCRSCASAISGPITETIYYLRYPGSLVTDFNPSERRLKDFLSSRKPWRAAPLTHLILPVVPSCSLLNQSGRPVTVLCLLWNRRNIGAQSART